MPRIKDPEDKTGVRKLTDRPLFIGIALLLSFVIVAAMIGFSRTGDRGQKGRQEESSRTASTDMLAEELIKNAPERLVIPQSLQPADEADIVTSQPVIIAGDEGLPDMPSLQVPLYNQGPPVPPALSENERKVAQLKAVLFEQALLGKTGVNTPQFDQSRQQQAANPALASRPGSNEEMLARIQEMRRGLAVQAGSQQGNVSEVYRERLAMIQNAGLLDNQTGGGMAAMLPAGGTLPSGTVAAAQGDRWLIEGGGKPQPPRTAYELRAGAVLPALMVSGINSDLPGQVIAQVSQDVYDTATGRYLLIPQGTRLVGSYNSDVQFGQERVMMIWQRLIFPDGKALDLGSMPGADSAGYSGFADQVETHFWRTIGSAFLMSLVIAGVDMSQDDYTRDRGNNTQRAGDALSEALGQTLGQTLSQMIMRNLNVAPTIRVRPGYRFNVMLIKDIPFESPYRHFDYH